MLNLGYSEVLKMYNVNIARYQKELLEQLPEDRHKTVVNLFKNIAFKLEKNLYYYTNILDNIDNIHNTDDFRSMLPIYFDIETLLISLRSSIDVVLHLINDVMELGIESNDVHIGSIRRRLKRGSRMFNVLNRYTGRGSGDSWQFLYYFRNDIVHERSIYELMDFYLIGEEGNERLYVDFRNKRDDFIQLFRNCFRIVDGFSSSVFKALVSFAESQK